MISTSPVQTLETSLPNWKRMGIGLIEIGHGMGLNASSPKNGIAAQTDEEYMRAAGEVLTEIQIRDVLHSGHCTTGGSAARCRLWGLVYQGRINADQIPLTEPYIREAKDLGLT